MHGITLRMRSRSECLRSRLLLLPPPVHLYIDSIYNIYGTVRSTHFMRGVVLWVSVMTVMTPRPTYGIVPAYVAWRARPWIRLSFDSIYMWGIYCRTYVDSVRDISCWHPVVQLDSNFAMELYVRLSWQKMPTDRSSSPAQDDHKPLRNTVLLVPYLKRYTGE